MNRNLWLISKSILMLAICLTLIGAITVTAQAKLPIEQIPHQESHPAALIDGEVQAGGTISGTVTCLGFISEATNEVFVDLHFDSPQSIPDPSIHIACNQPYQFTGVPDGTYYIGAWLDENDSGDGPPDPGEPHEYFGAPDPIVISSATPTHTDVDLELYRYVERVSLFGDKEDTPEERAYDSEEPAISGDGRHVVFHSSDWANRGVHIFDRELDTSTWFGIEDYNDFFEDPDISADGIYVAAAYHYYDYEFPSNNVEELIIKEWAVEASIPTIIEPWETNEPCFTNPSISGDGCRVAFQFEYFNSEYINNIYLHDCDTDQTTLISVAEDGEEPGNDWSGFPAISDDGQFVVFKSEATDLVIPAPPIGEDLFEDLLYVRDIAAGTTELIPPPEGISGGEFYDPSISADGRFVAYQLNYDIYKDVYVYDRDTEQTIKIPKIDSEIPEDNYNPSVSGDGRFVAYESFRWFESESLFYNNINIYDRELGTIKIAKSGFENMPDEYPEHPAISYDGRFIAFDSDAESLVVNDTNGTKDVFVYMHEPSSTIYLPIILK